MHNLQKPIVGTLVQGWTQNPCLAAGLAPSTSRSPADAQVPTPVANPGGFASESLPEVETVSSALRSGILEGKDVNLACLFIPHFDLGDYSRYTGVDRCQQLLRPLSSDPRLNRTLTVRICNLV